MSSQIPDRVIAAYFRDGKWEYQLMQVLVVCVGAPPCEQPAVDRCRRKGKAKRAPVAKCPSSKSLRFAIEALCASKLDSKTLQVQEGFLLRLRYIRLFSSCRVAGERFGQLEHFCLLIEKTSAPNVVVYVCAERQFFVVSKRRRQTQPVETRSAICWLRQKAGLGFCFDDERGVFRIDVSRGDVLGDDADPWREGLQLLLSSVSDAFPPCTFDEN